LVKNTFITGRPGIGKSSVLLKTVTILKNKGYEVGGMISCELRKKEARMGFEIVDLNTGSKGLLAHVNQETGPSIGKYRVNLADLKNIGVNSILNAIDNSDIVVIDEIGPMELFSFEFRNAIKKALNVKKPIIGTIHYRVSDPLLETIRIREDLEILKVTLNNRGNLHNILVYQIIKYCEDIIRNMRKPVGGV
jgi:nucleoside-triphosphatase